MCRWRRTVRAVSSRWRPMPAMSIGIELLAAAQACDFLAPLASSAPLETVRSLLRSRVPGLSDDRYFAADIASATDLVMTGELGRMAGRDVLPALQTST